MKHWLLAGVLLLFGIGCGSVTEKPIRLPASGPAVISGETAIIPAAISSADPVPLKREKFPEKISPVSESDLTTWLNSAAPPDRHPSFRLTIEESAYLQTHDFALYARYLRWWNQLAARQNAIARSRQLYGFSDGDPRWRQSLGFLRLQLALESVQNELQKIAEETRLDMRRVK